MEISKNHLGKSTENSIVSTWILVCVKLLKYFLVCFVFFFFYAQKICWISKAK